MCYRKNVNKRSMHVTPVHAEFMSCENTAADELLLSANIEASQFVLECEAHNSNSTL